MKNFIILHKKDETWIILIKIFTYFIKWYEKNLKKLIINQYFSIFS